MPSQMDNLTQYSKLSNGHEDGFRAEFIGRPLDNASNLVCTTVCGKSVPGGGRRTVLHANSRQSNEGRWCWLPYRARTRWHWPAALASRTTAPGSRRPRRWAMLRSRLSSGGGCGGWRLWGRQPCRQPRDILNFGVRGTSNAGGEEVRKVAMLAVVVAVVVLAFAGVALAVNKTCTKDPCRGTSAKDTLREQTGNDVDDNISGRKKADKIDASEFNNDEDRLGGGSGNDNLDADDDDDDDVLNGGKGTDTCNGDNGDEGISCEEGNLADD